MQPSTAAQRLERSWWQPQAGPWQWCLSPLVLIYAVLVSVRKLAYRFGLKQSTRLPVPVVVVGNYIVGGAGKTPTTMALLQALRDLGWRPGVVSRGYGRQQEGTALITATSTASEVGDEPLLIFRRTQLPVAVSRRRADAAKALMAAHPDINLIVADDGLQHWGLARDAQLVVFDHRGAGNGWTLPAGPLREGLPTDLPPDTWVVYNAPSASTPLPGFLVQRGLSGALSLEAWRAGQSFSLDTLDALRRESHIKPVLAAAGLAEPERFFSMLVAAGFQLERMPLPDHAPLQSRPWPADRGTVLVTEKDAVKLTPQAAQDAHVWVIGLDFSVPPALTQAVHDRLRSLYPTISP